MKNGMVIVHYNDLESVTNLINNIKTYSVLDKIIIVDNNSKKEIVDELKKLENKKIEIVLNNDNKGFSYAINIGCKKLIQELGKCNLIISNADIEINKEEDLEKLLKYLDNEEFGVVAPTVLENGNLNRGWKNPTPILDILMNLVYVHRIVRKKHIFYNNEHYNNSYSIVDVVSGCFFLIRSDTLEKINMFDENVFLYYEENILAKKIKNINKKIIVINDIKIKHNHSVSIDKNIKKIKKLKLQKKSEYYFQKEYNHANIIERILLKLTAGLSLFILRIVYFIKDIFKK